MVRDVRVSNATPELPARGADHRGDVRQAVRPPPRRRGLPRPDRALRAAAGHRPGHGGRRDLPLRRRRAQAAQHRLPPLPQDPHGRTPTSPRPPRGSSTCSPRARSARPRSCARSRRWRSNDGSWCGAVTPRSSQRWRGRRSPAGSPPGSSAAHARRDVPQRRDLGEDGVLPRLRRRRALGLAAPTRAVQQFEARLRLKSNAPRDISGLPDYVTGTGNHVAKGSMLERLYIYGPAGGRDHRASWPTARRRPVFLLHNDGRPVAFLNLVLKPQQRIDLTARFETAPGQRGGPDVQLDARDAPGTHERHRALHLRLRPRARRPE